MIEKVTLENEFVRLEPLDQTHVDGLWEAARHPEIWDYMPIAVKDKQFMPAMIQHAEQMHAAGGALAFTVFEKKSHEIVGSTGFWNADLANRRVEIGFTWFAPKWQRTAVNTSCKLLMLEHALETLALNRVEFKTDSLNQRSQTALRRIGATEEGTLRNHMVQPDGRLRHSVYFSILKDEWPQVKQQLVAKLASGHQA